MVDEKYDAEERPMTREEIEAELALMQSDMAIWILLKKEGGGIRNDYMGRLVQIEEEVLHVKQYRDGRWHSDGILIDDIYCLLAMTEERWTNFKESAKPLGLEFE